VKLKFELLFFIVLCLATPAQGETDQADANVSGAPWLDIGVAHRIRYETLDNRYKLGENGSDQQLPQRTRVRIEIKKVILPFAFVMEFESARTHLNDSGSTINNTMVNENDITNLHVSFATKPLGKANLTSNIYVGRQTFDLGSRRFLARNRFRNTTNSFDAIRWTLGDKKNWQLTMFVSRPVLRRLHKPDIPDTTGVFWGALGAVEFTPPFKNEFYYFGIRESQTSPKSNKRQYSTIGTRMYRSPKTGELSYELETAIQFGKKGTLDHLAHFEHISVDYTFSNPWRPKLTGRYDYASGTKNPASQNNGTFDTLYGARRFEHGPTGIHGAFYRSNTNSPGWALVLNPTKKLNIMSAMRWVWLASAHDQWVGTELRDPTGDSGKYLGSQIEMRLRYNFNKYFQSELGYSHFIKGSYLEIVPDSTGSEDSNYFYVQTTFQLDHLLQAF